MMKEVYTPMNEMMEVIDHALMNNYSLAWASDVSEEGFSFRQGMALVPLDGAKIKKPGKDNKTSDADSKESTVFAAPCEEKKSPRKYDSSHLTITKQQTITGCI